MATKTAKRTTRPAKLTPAQRIIKDNWEAKVGHLTPNEFFVIEFTTKGPRPLPTFTDEAQARIAYDALEHAYIAGQFRTYQGEQLAAAVTIWKAHK